MNHLEKQEEKEKEKIQGRKRGDVMEMRKIKKQKGITLVALVVTIVVLLILAGITITALFGENGIISQAQKAKTATEQDETNTQQGLKDLEEFIEQETMEKVEPKNIDDWEYEVDRATNTITITKYTGRDTEVVIPNYIGDLPVKRIKAVNDKGYSSNIWDPSICDPSVSTDYRVFTKFYHQNYHL